MLDRNVSSKYPFHVSNFKENAFKCFIVVMANSMCQHVWATAPRYLVKHSRCLCGDIFG